MARKNLKMQELSAPLWEAARKLVHQADPPLSSLNLMEHVLEIESIPSMSLKKTAISFFTPLGYRYITGKDQVHILRKINGYHHGIEVEMDRAPLSKRIASYLHFIGYNFYLTYCLPDFTPLNQEQLDEFVRCVAQITDYMEKQCTELLYECFGSTPEWYVY